MFPMYGVDRRIIYAVLIGLTIYSLMGMTSNEIVYLILTAPAVLVAIGFHEFAHANAADKLGDTTPRSQGRLTLNPFKHLDWFGTFLLFFAHIGWGKPVEINSNNFNSNHSRGFCEAMVALAGPLMNFFIAIVTSIVYGYFIFFQESLITTNMYAGVLMQFLDLLMKINIGLGVFNLIPLPPLDGEKIFRNIIPFRVKDWLDRNYYTLYIIFMILWFCGLLEVIVAPVIQFLLQLLLTGTGYLYAFVFWVIGNIFG